MEIHREVKEKSLIFVYLHIGMEVLLLIQYFFKQLSLKWHSKNEAEFQVVATVILILKWAGLPLIQVLIFYLHHHNFLKGINICLKAEQYGQTAVFLRGPRVICLLSYSSLRGSRLHPVAAVGTQICRMEMFSYHLLLLLRKSSSRKLMPLTSFDPGKK